MKPIRPVFVSMIILILMNLLTACSTTKANNVPNTENKSVTVRVAHFPNITHAQALVGRAEGQFQKALGEANKIEWKVFNAGPSEIEALFAGEVDIGYIGPGPAINGFAKSKGELQIIAGATNAGAILVSGKDLIIKDIRELANKKVAVPQFGNTQDLSLRYILKQKGLKDAAKGGNVEIRQAGNPDIKTLLDRGDIDAAMVPEPWGSMLVKEIQANVVLEYNQVWREGRYATAVVIARKEFIQDHPDIVEKFIKAHVELTDYINQNLEKTKDTINAQIKDLAQKPLPKDVLDASFTRLTVTNNPEKDSIAEFVDLSVGSGYLRVQPDISGLFDLNILNKVLRHKGQKEIE